MHGHMNVEIYNVIVTANALVIIFFRIMPIWELSGTFNTRSTRRSIPKNKQYSILISPTMVRSVQRANNSDALGMFWHLGMHEESFKFRPLLYPWERANGNHTVGCWMDFSVLQDVAKRNSSNCRNGNCTLQQLCIVSLAECFILYKHVTRYQISIVNVYICMYIDIKSYIVLGLFVPSCTVPKSTVVRLPGSALKFLVVWPTHEFFQTTKWSNAPRSFQFKASIDLR